VPLILSSCVELIFLFVRSSVVPMFQNFLFPNKQCRHVLLYPMQAASKYLLTLVCLISTQQIRREKSYQN
jgi:hypothetical protein